MIDTAGGARSPWRGDIIGGLTTAVMLVPQGMAYAMLAGLPPIVGLYASVAPLVAYALVGSSRQLAVGPVAMDSLLTAAVVGAVAQSGSERYVELAALLAIMVGVLQVLLGLVRGGFLVNFLSRPVVSGFTSAAAIVIAVSQLGLLTGVSLPRSTSVIEVLGAFFGRIGDIHTPTLAMAAGAVLALVLMKRYAPKWPRALLVVVAGVIVAGPLGLAERGLAVVGDIPAGLPTPALPSFELADIETLAMGALTIAFVAFMEGISVSTKLAEAQGTRVNPNREFLALGLANLASGLSRGYPVAGGFSRTAVNADAGAQSKRAGLITAAVVALVLGLLTGALRDVPRAVLGAIILTAVAGLIDLAEPRRLLRIKRIDLGMLLATFAATLLLGIQQGILVGVGLSLLVMLVRTTQPHTAVLGKLPGTTVYRNVERYAEAETEPGVLAVRLDAQLYFGNVSYLRDTLAALEERRETPLRAVILDATGINQLDSSAEQALRDLYEGYRRRGIPLLLAGLKGPVRDVLGRSGLMDELGTERVFFEVHEAMCYLCPELRRGDEPARPSPCSPTQGARCAEH
ncbi:SulP family inorganic anion transporter [Haliangium ochraceum]|uniref:Sulfate transporter n=1 Tax=Haliangium ochraceum (strain DSM 14365 / JCM 11303 / SMP-2) TaxID=502025 RepID=D0LJ39_HALO1|nr:sulfate permease [Haliangium ochraceum]ACY14886.1 sulfate transporter [Haliangium ochraceum DSM 14365]